MRFIKFHIILVWVFSTFAFAQEKTPPKFPQPFNDSLKVDTSRVRDTTKADSLAKKDSAAASSGIDTVVNYSAKDSVVYSINSKKMSMYNNGDIKYRDMRLTAERVNVNWATSILDAHGIPDTTKDSVKTKRESPDETEPVKADTARKKFKGIPMMKDGPETYHGSELSYNFKTKKGKINVGETHMDEGYYRGQDIKKVDPDVLFIQDGRYTTCDAAEPHYYFASPRMKVMAKDKIVAEPVYLYIADVPVFALPFAVFPNKSGRRSGLIMPAAYLSIGSVHRMCRSTAAWPGNNRCATLLLTIATGSASL